MIQSSTFGLVLLLSVVVFWLLPKSYRFNFLAIVSISYLATIELKSTLVLLVWTVAFYWLAPQTIGNDSWRRWLLSTLIMGILSYLLYFKYLPPLLEALSFGNEIACQVILPLGISYFTFKFIHYVVEVARGNIQDRSLPQFFCYIFLFPIFSAGPIERFDHFLTHQEERWQLDSMVAGLTRIIQGLIKKFFFCQVVILSLLGPHQEAGFPNANFILERLDLLPTYKIWGFLILSYLYIYIDFSAYSDIAIGASRLFGIRIMENFNWPILATNIADFWQRWHMTLRRWCQAYVYMPMIGLTRNPYLAIYSTWLIIGLWHSGSLNWIAWGLYHSTGVAVFVKWERFKRRKQWFFLNQILLLRYVSMVITFLFVAGGGVFIANYDHHIYNTLRILAKLFFINLPT